MRINKGQFQGQLKERIVTLLSAEFKIKNHNITLIQVPTHTIITILKNQQELGIPKYISLDLDNGRTILVAPRCNRRYDFRVLGTKYIEQ